MPQNEDDRYYGQNSIKNDDDDSDRRYSSYVSEI